MTLKELLVKIGFETDESKLNKVNEQLEGIKHRLEFLAAAEVIKGIFELTEKFTKFAEELHVASVSAGITVESFQRLAFAAGQSNISQEEMSMSMARLSRHLFEAKTGSAEAQRAFMQVGFTPQQVNSFHTGRDALLAMADRFKEIQDPIKKQALLMQLTGRGSVNMAGFLSQGSAAIRGMGDEAEELGLILSGEQVEALVKVEHAMLKLWGVVKAFGATLASLFAPSVESAINELLAFYKANKDLLNLEIKAWVWDITYAMGAVWAAIKFVTQSVFDFIKAHELLTRRIGETLLVVGALVSTLVFLHRMWTLVRGAITIVTESLSVLRTVGRFALEPLLWVVGLAQSALSGLLVKLAVMAETAFPAVSEALLAMGAALEATPIGWIATAIAALVVVCHDLWKLWNGGSFKDTWIGQAFDAVKGLGGKALNFFGIGGGGENAAANTKGAENLANLSDVASKTPDFGGAALAQNSSSVGDYTINAPINMNFPAGTDHQAMGQKVKEGIHEHLDRVHRDTYRALRPRQAQ